MVHTKEWFDENAVLDSSGDYKIDVTTRSGLKWDVWFTIGMSPYFGKVVTVQPIDKDAQYFTVYSIDKSCNIDNCFWCWYPEMFE